MQPHHSLHKGVRSPASQFDLFVPAAKDDADQVLPPWQTLPEQTRQTLTSLLARLILDHASANHAPLSEESQP
jgi:hypothetical protein